MLDPVALMWLKLTSECSIELPEALFDIDFPGHYMRRIKAVSLSIPCVTGPYASVNCTLSLQSSRIRVNSKLQLADPKYVHTSTPPDAPPDDRFVDDFSTTQSIVTSNGQNDSGLFETNLHDERYLPFEGAGVVSKWRITLPSQFKQFDYDTISDVVMHIRYTARGDGGPDFANAATDAVESFLGGSLAQQGAVGSASGPPLALIVSLKQQFPSEWARLTAPGTEAPRQGFAVDRSKFPFALAGHTLTVDRVDLFATSTKASPVLTLTSPPMGTAPAKPFDLLTGVRADPAQGPFLYANAHSYSTNGARSKENLAFAVPDDPTAATWTLSGAGELTMLRDVVLVFTYSAARHETSG
jgi:hypothetical protein